MIIIKSSIISNIQFVMETVNQKTRNYLIKQIKMEIKYKRDYLGFELTSPKN